MITPEYLRVMAAYNSEMNRRIYAGAARLIDARADFLGTVARRFPFR